MSAQGCIQERPILKETVRLTPQRHKHVSCTLMFDLFSRAWHEFPRVLWLRASKAQEEHLLWSLPAGLQPGQPLDGPIGLVDVGRLREESVAGRLPRLSCSPTLAGRGPQVPIFRCICTSPSSTKKGTQKSRGWTAQPGSADVGAFQRTTAGCGASRPRNPRGTSKGVIQKEHPNPKKYNHYTQKNESHHRHPPPPPHHVASAPAWH